MFKILTLVFVLGGTPSAPSWTYGGERGPEHWGALDSAYETCQAGKSQSPIDIRQTTRSDLAPLEFDYRPFALKVIDNGHAIEVKAEPGSFLSVGNQRYELQQFHFHHPAEEKVNGASFPMVAHLVHKNAEGKLAVVAVLLTSGKANPLVAEIWRRHPGMTVNPVDLLPSDKAYDTYQGSLTTPPCTEGVTWFVLQKPAQISEEQISAFAKKYPNNARPIQPLNGRNVQATK